MSVKTNERGYQPSVLADTTTVSQLRSRPERREAEHYSERPHRMPPSSPTKPPSAQNTRPDMKHARVTGDLASLDRCVERSMAGVSRRAHVCRMASQKVCADSPVYVAPNAGCVAERHLGHGLPDDAPVQPDASTERHIYSYVRVGRWRGLSLGLASHGPHRRRVPSLDHADRFETVTLVQRLVPRIRRLEKRRKAIPVTAFRCVAEQHRSESAALPVAVDTHERQVPVRLGWMKLTLLLHEGEDLVLSIGQDGLGGERAHAFLVRSDTGREPQRNAAAVIDRVSGALAERGTAERLHHRWPIAEIQIGVAQEPSSHGIVAERDRDGGDRPSLVRRRSDVHLLVGRHAQLLLAVGLVRHVGAMQGNKYRVSAGTPTRQARRAPKRGTAVLCGAPRVALSVLSITLDREDVAVRVLEPGHLAAPGARRDSPLVSGIGEAALEHAVELLEDHAPRTQLIDHQFDIVDMPTRQGR